MDEKNNPNALESEQSLDTPETVVESGANPAETQTPLQNASTNIGDTKNTAPTAAKPPRLLGLKRFLSRFNIYLLLFVLIAIISVIITVVVILRSRQESAEPALTTQELTAETLEQLKNSTAKVGDARQILSIESNAVFSGTVLIRDSLEVAGQIKVGGSLSLPGITVSGASSFDQVQINNMSIAGDASIQGQLTVAKNLTINGGASFGAPISAPQISVDRLQLNGDLQLNRHIDAGGSTPSKSDGTALGNGGTANVGGTDTAGTININTGSNPATGCFVTITFAQKFNDSPHVIITPVGSAAAGLNYYINRSSANFSVCTTNAAPPGSSFAFDYIAID